MPKAAEKAISTQQELEVIRGISGDGILRAEDAVNWAEEHPDSALHSKLQWDDEKAGHQYRIWQMRRVIEVSVTIIEQCSTPVQTYVSLIEDRSVAGGGYRILTDVLCNKEQREKLLGQALGELKVWKKKYSELKELAEVFVAANNVVMLRG